MLTSTRPIYLLDDLHPQARVCAACEVRKQALFGALDEHSLESIHSHIASPSFEAGDTIYPLGAKGGAVYTVRSGIVRFECITEEGDRRVVRLAGRSDLIGQEALLHQGYAEEAIACTPVELCRIPQTLIDELGQSNPAFMKALMNRWQMALEQAQAWVSDLTTGSARRRMLKLLARLEQLSTETPGVIWLPRREEMGVMLDITVETASRTLSQLRREGVLDITSARTALVHMGPLQALLGQTRPR